MSEWVLVGKSTIEQCPSCQGKMLVFQWRGFCSNCGLQFKKPKPEHEHRRVVDLTDDLVISMLDKAKDSTFDETMLESLAAGFRRSELSGGYNLPGLQREDIRLDEEAIWVRGKKKHQDIKQPLPLKTLERASVMVKKGRIFQVINETIENHVRRYAKLTGFQDWNHIGPHSLRHWFSNSIKTNGGLRNGPEGQLEWMDVMRHSRKGSVTTLAFYGGPFTSFERRKEIVFNALRPVLEA